MIQPEVEIYQSQKKYDFPTDSMCVWVNDRKPFVIFRIATFIIIQNFLP